MTSHEAREHQAGRVGATARVYRPNSRLKLEGRSLAVLQRREAPGVR